MPNLVNPETPRMMETCPKCGKLASDGVHDQGYFGDDACKWSRLTIYRELLAASQQDVERLRTALEDQHKATDDLWNERTELRAQLADAQAELITLRAQLPHGAGYDAYKTTYTGDTK